MDSRDIERRAVSGAVARTVRRSGDAAAVLTRDLVADEVPVAIAYNDAPFAVMMATPCDLEDFAIGFSLSEGIIERATDVAIDAIDTWVDGVAVQLRIPASAADALQLRRRNLQGRSGCGICGSESIEAALRPPARLPQRLHTDAVSIMRAMSELRQRQPLNAITGATHAAGWASPDGGIALVREDVGRHNALDKLIGGLHCAGFDPREGFVVITSRASYEMALKAARAGIELLAAISAPTSLAIALADSAGQTLLGFVREADHVAYTHAWRLREPSDRESTS